MGEDRMKKDLTGISATAKTETELKAAEIFAKEIKLRTGKCSRISQNKNEPCIVFSEDNGFNCPDRFDIDIEGKTVTVRAGGIRGFIYGIGMFLRKTEYADGRITLVSDISGSYTPDKKIRGHQLGYRPLSNTYDKWDLNDYRRAYLDIMYFGANTVEHIPGKKDERHGNSLMRYGENELLFMAAEAADEIDLDVSLWYPNSEDSRADAAENRKYVFDGAKRINAVFPPGGDPGSLPADEFIARCRIFKNLLNEKHPDAEMWPSAQAPHGIENWGESFIKEISDAHGGIDGIITGPNHAFPPDELRRRVPSRYPIRFYPDITHNLRCEHPVHFDRDDWNYALAAANGREAINPRPEEYAFLHKLISPYTVGSVTYSEGVNDDVNKAVWCALEFNGSAQTREIIDDYARLFFYGADTQSLADGIFGLEKNWEGAPENNPQIENTLRIFCEAAAKNPSLMSNWRFLMCLFRAETDAYVRRRVMFDRELTADAVSLIKRGRSTEAEKVLSRSYPSEITSLRADIEANAERLFDTIGIQLGTKRFFADGWERGAVLDTVDLPVTNKEWLLNRLKKAKDLPCGDANAYLLRSINRNRVAPDEYCFSVALDGLAALGEKQRGEFYTDTQADKPNKNDGTLPTCLFKLYDHFSLHAALGGFAADTDYVLMITYQNSTPDEKCDFKIKANGKTVYSGDRFGGRINVNYTAEMLPDGFTAVMYGLPSDCFENGCLKLEITEPFEGFKFGEFRITKKEYGEDSI